MKIYFRMLLLIAPFLFLSCSNANSPDDKNDDQYTISTNAYGFALDSTYFKVWSDNSWERAYRVITINNQTYITILTSDGTEYYYSSAGYAGFKPSGESLILFNTPIASLPDKLVFGQKYTQQTTFPYAGYNYTMKIEQVLRDTVSLSVPCGTFNSCLWFKYTATLTSLNPTSVSNEQFWVAIGPAEIQTTLNSGTTIKMVNGTVNGRNWGTYNLIEPANIPKKQKSFSLDNIIRPVIHFIK